MSEWICGSDGCSTGVGNRIGCFGRIANDISISIVIDIDIDIGFNSER